MGTTTTTTTTTTTPRYTFDESTMRITAIMQARLCLFQGICDTPGAEEYYRTSLDPTASTSTTTSPLVSQVNTALLAQIQRCIQTPLHCNTNLIPAPVIRSTISTTTTTTTTTSSAKPSS